MNSASYGLILSNGNHVMIHYGVLGMKWGRRKAQRTLNKLSRKRTASNIKALGNVLAAEYSMSESIHAKQMNNRKREKKYGDKFVNYYNKANRLTKETSHIDDMIKSAISEINKKGYKITTEKTNQLYYRGYTTQDKIESAIVTIGSIPISMLTGNPAPTIAAASIGALRGVGVWERTKYKVKKQK